MNSNEKFIIGLGNPGKEYIKNRHNIGFLLLEHFSKKHNSKFVLKNMQPLVVEHHVQNFGISF